MLLFTTAKCMELWASRSLRWHCIVRWAARARSSSSPSLPALCFFHQKFSWRFLREGEGGEMKQDPGESEMDAGGCSDEMI